MHFETTENLQDHALSLQIKYPDRYLFRGQRLQYQHVSPTLHREEGLIQGQAYTVLRRLAGQARNQIFASDIRGLVTASAEEAIALLQHLGWPTPYLDLTDDVNTAIFFACDRYRHDDGPAELIIVDRSSIPDSWRLIAHSDVLDPDLNLRWSRQRGYALLPPGWPGLRPIQEVDLLLIPGVERLSFSPSAISLERAKSIRNWIYIDDSEISMQMKFLVRSVAEACGLTPLHERLAKFPY